MNVAIANIEIILLLKKQFLQKGGLLLFLF